MRTARSLPVPVPALGLLLLGSLLVACSSSPPKARDQIRFEHAPHLREGATCTGCHATLQDAPLVSATDDDAGVEPSAADPDAGPAPGRPLPKEAQCRSCHKGPEDSRCGHCHEQPRAPATYPDRPHSIRFDHGRQIPEHVRDCMRCHGTGQAAESVAEFEPRLPPMRACTESCHAAEMSALECGKCHLGLSAYPREALDLVRHAPGFLKAHGPMARAEDNLCAQCHEPTFCIECHTATPNMPRELLRATEIDRDFVHAADFQSRHPAEARLDQASCLRCHGVDFCDGCHQASGIGGGVGPGSPHPPGWLDAMSGNSHAAEARRNILSCAGCHESDAEQTCVPCHRVGSIAGNPHPPGFGTGYDKNQQGLCRVCHGAGG
jgi:hypothetical protein